MDLRLLTVLLVSAVVPGIAATGKIPIVGGLTEERDVTHDVQAIIDIVRPEVEKELDVTLSQYKGVNYKTQVVSGTNYFVKVDIGNGVYIHIRVYQSLDDDVSLSGVDPSKTLDDPINYF